MNTKVIVKRLFAAFIVVACITLCSCSSDTATLLIEKEFPNQPIEFTQDEGRYLTNLHKSNRVSRQEAIDKIIEESNTSLTRGTNDLQEIGIIYKNELGIETNDTLLPDTLAYLFESENQKQRYIVSADNRTSLSLLAETDSIDFYNDSTETDLIINDIIRKGIANYVRNEIKQYEEKKDSILKEIKYKLSQLNLHDSAVVVTRRPVPGENDIDYNDISIEEYTIEDWHEITYINPMISVTWDQREPYNNYVKSYLSCNSVPTGCVTTAIAQLMTKWSFPQNGNWPSYYGWLSLIQNPAIYPNGYNDSTVDLVANLMKRIFDDCITEYDCDDSSSTLDIARSYLTSLGYTADNIIYYSGSAVISSLNNGCPVLIGGYYTEESGHCWIIDGYQRKKKTTRRVTYAFDRTLDRYVVIHTSDYDSYSTMVSNNWGDGHPNKRWLIEGCFDYNLGVKNITRMLSDGSVIYNVRIVTNIHPNI